MRQFTVVSLVLLFSGFAVGQATIINGYASDWAPSYGVYAAPFVPRVVTPSVSLESVSPSGAGASNATFGNVAGATNSTLSIINQVPVGVYTVPVWYGPSAASPAVARETGPRRGMEETHRHHRTGGYVAAEEYSMSVKTLMAEQGAGRKASRTYTNNDIDRLNQSTGQVKYDGKTEEIH